MQATARAVAPRVLLRARAQPARVLVQFCRAASASQAPARPGAPLAALASSARHAPAAGPHCGTATTAAAYASPRPPRAPRHSIAPAAAAEGAAGRGGAMSSSSGSAGSAPAPVPLKAVVQAAVRRWFEDTLIEAQRGDVKQQALLAQMYAEGYGCERDPRAAAEWAEKARLRGYKMNGVYCSL